MTPRKRPAHAGLDRHDQRFAKAREALRRAEDDERRAASAVEDARDQVREAHDVGADAGEATVALARAKQDLEQATLRREGIEARVKRASAERLGYLEEHWRSTST